MAATTIAIVIITRKIVEAIELLGANYENKNFVYIYLIL